MPPVRESSQRPNSTGNTTPSRNGISQTQSAQSTMTNGARHGNSHFTTQAQTNHAGPASGVVQNEEDETQSQTNDTNTPLTNEASQSEADETQTQTDYTSTVQINSAHPGQQHGAQPQQPQPRLNLGRTEYDTPDKMVHYVCAACNTTGGFKANDVLRCHKCGGMTMHKPRIKGYVSHASYVRGVRNLLVWGCVRVLQYSAN